VEPGPYGAAAQLASRARWAAQLVSPPLAGIAAVAGAEQLLLADMIASDGFCFEYGIILSEVPWMSRSSATAPIGVPQRHR